MNFLLITHYIYCTQFIAWQLPCSQSCSTEASTTFADNPSLFKQQHELAADTSEHPLKQACKHIRLPLNHVCTIMCDRLQPKWHKVKGLRESLGDGHVVSNMAYKTAPHTFKALQNLKEGHAVFTMPSGAIKCPGAGQKACYISGPFATSCCYCDSMASHALMPADFSPAAPADRILSPTPPVILKANRVIHRDLNSYSRTSRSSYCRPAADTAHKILLAGCIKSSYLLRLHVQRTTLDVTAAVTRSKYHSARQLHRSSASPDTWKQSTRSSASEAST